MITDWDSFEQWRRAGIAYHKESEYRYLNALTFFEFAREYFNRNGFPEDNRVRFKSGEHKGEKKPWSDKEKKQQQEDIRAFIKEQMEIKRPKRRKKYRK